MAKFESHPLRGTVSKRCSSAFYDHFSMDITPQSPSDEYNEETNPKGFIDLRTAVNGLCEDMIEEHLNSSNFVRYSKLNQHYTPNEGKKDLLEAVAAFLTRRFDARTKVEADKVVITNGVTGAFDLLAHILADPGDTFVCFGPSYSHIFWDTKERAEVQSHVIPLSSKEAAGQEGWEMNAQQVEDAIVECQKEGKTVKALMLINPHNPLGSVLSASTLTDILEVCKRYAVHVIADEIYGLSVWDESIKFVSVLSLDSIPDPSRTHVLWGLSKDLGLAGCRIGAVYTLNPCVLHALKKLSYFSMASSIVQDLATRLLYDNEWLDSYFKEYHSRAKEAFKWARARLESMGVPVHPARAGFSIWADFRSFLKVKTVEDEMAFFKKLMTSTNVALVPGDDLCCSEPGWCRIIFTVPRNLLETALSRMETFLVEHKAVV